MVHRLSRIGAAVAVAVAGFAVAVPAATVAAAATIYVSPSPVGTPIGSSCTLPNFNTIQAAVTAGSAGDTIVVCPGTYAEQVSVGKNLTLAGSGNAIIQAPATLLEDANSKKKNVVEVKSGASVTMAGFTVAGPGPVGCGSIDTGIAVLGGASLNLSNTTIRDIRDSPFSGCQNGEGIRIGTPRYSATPDVGSATINNVNVYDYQKNGIVVAGSVGGVNSSARITNTVTTGQGPTAVIANNGIEVVNGATASISSSTIRDNFYTGTQNAVACGLLIISSSGVSNDSTNVYLGNQKNICVHSKGGGFQA
jgi:hypothetical protein